MGEGFTRTASNKVFQHTLCLAASPSSVAHLSRCHTMPGHSVRMCAWRPWSVDRAVSRHDDPASGLVARRLIRLRSRRVAVTTNYPGSAQPSARTDPPTSGLTMPAGYRSKQFVRSEKPCEKHTRPTSSSTWETVNAAGYRVRTKQTTVTTTVDTP
jgi:hypothetical protein